MKHKVTAIIPAGNEEENIAAAIESVLFADEILVIDSYSTDRTVEIAQQYPVTILQRKFDFPARQKNWAMPQASHDWILLLDADERVTPELQEEIKNVLNQDKLEAVAYWVYRTNFFMNKEIRYSGWQDDKVIRLCKKDVCTYKDVKVHEEIIADGPTAFLKNKLEHHTYRGLDHFLEKSYKYATWGAYDRLEKTKNVTAFHFVVKPFFGFIKKYFLKRGVLDGKVGFILALQYSQFLFLRALKLWRLKQGENLKK